MIPPTCFCSFYSRAIVFDFGALCYAFSRARSFLFQNCCLPDNVLLIINVLFWGSACRPQTKIISLDVAAVGHLPPPSLGLNNPAVTDLLFLLPLDWLMPGSWVARMLVISSTNGCSSLLSFLFFSPSVTCLLIPIVCCLFSHYLSVLSFLV
jgi:hypothetical protein